MRDKARPYPGMASHVLEELAPDLGPRQEPQEVFLGIGRRFTAPAA